jgi:hypothetical protein
MIWQLWRQDDNGNKFLVGSFPTEESADEKMSELLFGHHKQTYWVCKEAYTEQ